jgi:type II secretory pathway pseudopilin PulG
MKLTLATVALAATLALPAVSFAQQSQQGLTRAEVRAQLVELEQAGYRPESEGPTYPERLQAAEARVAAKHAAQASR